MNIQQLRAETKGTKENIHFNNAGASLPTAHVLETVIRYLSEEAVRGGYETEAAHQHELDKVYDDIARLINARPDEIALVENASMAWHLAFNGLDFKPGDEVITSEMEYVTNHLGLLNAKRNYSITIRVIPNNVRGNFDLDALEKAITPRTKLIAITHIPSSAGNILPVVEIGRIARRHGILYLVDACQSAGQIPVDVAEIGCDFLAVTGRKYLRAPRGTGFLYVRKNIQDKLRLLLIDGHSITSVTGHDFEPRTDARRFELYEKNRALLLGLGAAVNYALDLDMHNIGRRITELAALLRKQLSAIDGVVVHDRGDFLGGIVTFSVAKLDAAAVKAALAAKNINVSITRPASTPVYMNRNQLSAAIRASLHYYNTEEEIDKLCAVINGLLL
jgi:selenocysteine lyase/cysteine desulfurase